MYYGMLSSEGLTDPLLLNSFKPIKVVVDYQPNANTKYWHRYLLQFSDDEMQTALEKISRLMKEEWFSIFWNEKIVHVVFTNKIFTLPKEEHWNSEEYKKIKAYGIAHGVQEVYMDFNDRFAHYNELLKP